MNEAFPTLLRRVLLGVAGIAFLAAASGCKSREFSVPELDEQPVLTKVTKQDFTETAPGYGIYSAGLIQVNVEAEDAPSIEVGQPARAQVGSDQASIPCKVVRILRRVNEETRSGIAWLRPIHPEVAGARLTEGDFVYATIVTRVLHGALAIPRAAVFIKDSKTWAIEQVNDAGKTGFKPVEVEVGLFSEGQAQILKGLSDGQVIATGGAIGYLYPDFKAASDD